MFPVETLNQIVALGAANTVVHEDSIQISVLANGVIHTIKKDNPQRGHTFTSLEGFLSYLDSDRSGAGPGVIFVGEASVKADLDYLSPVHQSVTLPLSFSEEYEALNGLMRGIGQKDLWRLLLTKLDGCIPVDLFMQISNIRVANESKADLQIERIGLGKVNAVSAIRVTYTTGKGSETADVGTEWVYEGRIWESYSKKFQIPLTMEVSTDGGLKFQFHPRKLETILRQARLELVGDVNAGVSARFTVHEGKF